MLLLKAGSDLACNGLINLLVPRDSRLPAPWSEKTRDPGNEVAVLFVTLGVTKQETLASKISIFACLVERRLDSRVDLRVDYNSLRAPLDPDRFLFEQYESGKGRRECLGAFASRVK